ncbi:MAG: PQQ-like beta-propeller repeat protein [Planctomycetes bacterium]|nr:PQQ-like beta-propeller repeat protein [Planctomycetota bacterium]
MRPLFSFLLIALAAANARADDWPQWMGPQRDNVWREKGILDTFPKGGPKVLWRAKVANGFSGPAVADGLVFLTDFVTDADIHKDNFDRAEFAGKERVQCFDAKTGDLKWKHDYPCTLTVSYPNGPRCTPNVEAGKVWTLGAEGDLICFDAKTGKIHWQRDFKKDYKTATPLWGFAAHPLMDGDCLICMVGGEGAVAVAFDKNTGKEIWKALSAEEPGYSPPSIIEAGGVRQLIIWHPEAINGLDPATGKVFWSVKQTTVNGTSIMMPRKLDDHLFIGAWQHKGGLFKLDAKKPGLTQAWKGNRDTSVYPVNNTPFLEAGHIYGICNDGELRCVDIKTGERLWESLKAVGKKTPSGTAHLVKHADRFFITAETGDLIIAKLTPKGYNEISRWHMLDPTSTAYKRNVSWSHPAFAQQCVFARNDRELICVSLAK